MLHIEWPGVAYTSCVSTAAEGDRSCSLSSCVLVVQVRAQIARLEEEYRRTIEELREGEEESRRVKANHNAYVAPDQGLSNVIQDTGYL
jgi:hypothetical protein